MTPTQTTFQYDVFISYARKDGAEKAKALANALRDKGFRVYYDLYQNEPGIDWWQRIENAITASQALVFIITQGSISSSVCADEWTTAEKLNRPLLPVKVVDNTGNIIPDANIPAHISRIHYIDTVKDWTTGIEEIAHFLTRYDYLYELADDLSQLVSESTARRFIEIIATENAEAKQLKRRMRVRTLKRQPTQQTEFNSFDDAWTHYNGQVLLLGAPGAGKTTTLLHYAQTLVTNYLSDRNQPVPVFASIAYWDSYANQPLHEWLPEHNELPDDIHDVIYNGRAVLILDGLDELGSSKPINPRKPEEGTFDPRQRFMEQVQTAIDAGNQILITCRVADYEDIGEKLNIHGAIELQNLTDEQIETYLGDVPTVQQTVMADNGLLEICRSPLLLSLIAFGYRDATDDLKALPSMQEGDLRDAIFERYITANYDFEASRRELLGEEMPFTLEKIMDVLGHAAMINVSGGRRDDESDDFWGSKIIENILTLHDFTHQLKDDEIDNFLQFMNHMNVIEQDEDRNYRFLHLLIRDFLAYQFSTNNFDNSTFDEGFSVHIANSSNDLTGALGSRQFHPCYTLYKLQDKRSHDIFINTMYHSSNPKIREVSVGALEFIGDSKDIPILIDKLLKDNYINVRCLAAQVLGIIGDKEAVPALLDRLQTDPNPDVRRESMRALGKIGDTRAVPTLIQALNDLKDNEYYWSFEWGTLNENAAKALKQIGTPEALQAVQAWREQEAKKPETADSKMTFDDWLTSRNQGSSKSASFGSDNFNDDDELGGDWRSWLRGSDDD